MADTKIVSITGKAFHLPGDNIDTDRIIPADFLRCVTFEGLGNHVFENDRKQSNGTHPFDNPENNGCNILIADVNFGCGSSREHAVAALQRWGIKAIIARSFAAIFRGNATANGLVCVELSEVDERQLLKNIHVARGNVSIDLQKMEVVFRRLDPDWHNHPYWPCIMPSADRDMLITGKWDTIATLLEAGNRIEATASKLPYMQIAS